MANFQPHYDVLPGGSFRYYSDTIPSALGTGITGRVGDTCLNLAVGVGQPFAWACITAGSPGTWISSGQGSTLISTENGANNAIAGTLSSVSQTTGTMVRIILAHTLQAGANTFALNGGTATAIKSHFNPASNIATAYAVGAIISLTFNGTAWLDESQ